MKKIIFLLVTLLIFSSCKEDKPENIEEIQTIPQPKIIYEFGYKLNDYKVINDTIKKGESFGVILDRHHVDYPIINKIASKIKDTFDVRRVRAGKPYTILAAKDSTEKAQVFIYKNNKSVATIVEFNDSIIHSYKYRKEIKTIEKEVHGKIYSSFSQSMDSLHINPYLTNEIADIYAWTLDFFKLQKEDTFKIIYEEKFIDDSTFVGYGDVKAAVFNHKGTNLYAYRYIPDPQKGIVEYYDEEGNMLRSQFLKSPIKFQYRISSRYNLKRRIKHYGYKVKPHRGTDFAANEGTPIMATASGIVTESAYRKRGNGNYVKIKHNNTYSTQYLHMSKRKVKRGQYVKQGDIIGWVGHTGSTEGRHVCYRFWKNGRQVDPLKQKLPAAEPLKKSLKPVFLTYITPLKEQLENITNYKSLDLKMDSNDITLKN
ncbi:Murein DD-endopeptidase MepM [Polaribacter huanghezhanensis]|uniref:M23 family metallopeptidase n=1 Tax=Polaribacter huanghezhanensis TaxID=1354726 RepID=UPI002649A01E|nr:peptidoglycan DD-metalloendopeptidase family protein [Polaribacter huanghezhanensis]WKD85171.1 Murein DD-endopeptidase MepM [Polaribacter huanghezhanensis]